VRKKSAPQGHTTPTRAAWHRGSPHTELPTLPSPPPPSHTPPQNWLCRGSLPYFAPHATFTPPHPPEKSAPQGHTTPTRAAWHPGTPHTELPTLPSLPPPSSHTPKMALSSQNMGVQRCTKTKGTLRRGVGRWERRGRRGGSLSRPPILCGRRADTHPHPAPPHNGSITHS
jgi:hypothetical protein